MHAFILRQKARPDGYTTSSCLRMFGVSKSGYYAWVGRQEDRNGSRAQKEHYERDIMGKMRQIVVARNGIIPGKRTFRVELFRRFGITVNVKRIARLMKRMNLVAQVPHKDAYKHQATHNHVCAAPPNAVGQDFFVGPRQVILTDITYLYYGPERSVFYLCVFRDAYVRQNLGWAAGTKMDVGLVKEAYDAMMEKHGNELKGSAVYVHSDQGSQYLSTTFSQMLEDDGFVQSVSARGNSQDNAPMESFFGRLKADVIDLVARCRNLDAATRLVDGYLKAYNTEHYQYATTGIYPLDSYFGVSASEMMAVGDIKKVRRAYADEEARKRREAVAAKREARRQIDPVRTISRDQALLDRMISKWRQAGNAAQKQVEHLQGILEQTKEAMKYVVNLTLEALEELKDPLSWRKHEELKYVFAMNELF